MELLPPPPQADFHLQRCIQEWELRRRSSERAIQKSKLQEEDNDDEEDDDNNDEDNKDEILTQAQADKRLKLTFFLVVSQWTLLFPIAPDDHHYHKRYDGNYGENNGHDNDHKNDDDINDD